MTDERAGDRHLPAIEDELRQVQRLADPREVRQHMGLGPAWMTRLSWGAARVVDLRHEPRDHCTVLYACPEGWVGGLLDWPAERRWPLRPTDFRVPGLGLRLFPFADDPALEGLADVATSSAAGETLARLVSERVSRCHVRPLRYRPTFKATLRVAAWLGEPRGGRPRRETFCVQAFGDRATADLVAWITARLIEASATWRELIRVAPCVASSSERGLLVQSAVQGTPLDVWSRYVGSTSSARASIMRGVHASARALAILHGAGPLVPAVRRPETDLDDLRRRVRRVSEVFPAFGERCLKVSAALDEWIERVDRRGIERCFTHGEYKPSQVLVSPHGPGVAVLDLDGCAMGDPALDVGTYLATLAQMGLQRSRHCRLPWSRESRRQAFDALANAFLSTYQRETRASEELLWRARWYEAMALLRKALRAFARSRRATLPVQELDVAQERLASLGAQEPQRSHARSRG